MGPHAYLRIYKQLQVVREGETLSSVVSSLIKCTASKSLRNKQKRDIHMKLEGELVRKREYKGVRVRGRM